MTDASHLSEAELRIENDIAAWRQKLAAETLLPADEVERLIERLIARGADDIVVSFVRKTVDRERVTQQIEDIEADFESGDLDAAERLMRGLKERFQHVADQVHNMRIADLATSERLAREEIADLKVLADHGAKFTRGGGRRAGPLRKILEPIVAQNPTISAKEAFRMIEDLRARGDRCTHEIKRIDGSTIYWKAKNGKARQPTGPARFKNAVSEVKTRRP